MEIIEGRARGVEIFMCVCVCARVREGEREEKRARESTRNEARKNLDPLIANGLTSACGLPVAQNPEAISITRASASELVCI